jgi:hypothetical protein
MSEVSLLTSAALVKSPTAGQSDCNPNRHPLRMADFTLIGKEGCTLYANS